MKYEVRCANRDTGKEYRVLVEAASADSAVRQAARDGHLSSSASELILPSPPPVHAEPQHDYRGYLSGINDQLAALNRSRIIRAPIGTIAVSIIIAMILWGVLCFVLFMSLGALLAAAGMSAGR